MEPVHPFDAELAAIDPATRRVTRLDLTADPKLCLPIMLISLGTWPTVLLYELVINSLDSRHVLKGPQGQVVRFIAPGQESLFTRPLSIAAEPCGCSHTDAGPSWNPIHLALTRHDALHESINAITRAYVSNVNTHSEQYCPYGLASVNLGATAGFN